ncbi:MAG: ABC transporter substrate-binding protein [Pseudomonadota bacterium]
MAPVLALLLAFAGSPAAAEAPARVVSMNLCTDQLALMLAAPGQLVSVSHWASDPRSSNLVDRAAGLTTNRAGAEQIFLLQPDLVLAGSFTNRVGVDMLRRLGIRVEKFPAARSFDDIPVLIARMGTLLGREAEAEALIAGFRADLAVLAAAPGGARPEAAYHYPNNYTSGADTLAADVLAAAGFANAAERLGYRGARRLALETLVMAQPFLVRTRPISGGSVGRSYETAAHPALRRLAERGGAVVAERWQVCGTPFVLHAVRALAEARRAAAASARQSQQPRDVD